MRRPLAILIAVGALLLHGCERQPGPSGAGTTERGGANVYQGETTPRATTSSAKASGVTPRIADNTELKRETFTATAEEQGLVSARDLVLGARLLALTKVGENAVLSPWSFAQALAMAQAGARGATAQAFEAVLKGPMADADWHRVRSVIESAVKARGVGAVGKDGGPFRISAFNRLYGRSGISFEKPFLDSMVRWYGARLTSLDFRRAASDAVDHINAEVAKATENRIASILTSEHVNALTALVLVNTIYFNGGWQTPFDKTRTVLAPFHLEKGAVEHVPTMLGEAVRLRSAAIDEVDVIELPYDGGQVSMLVLMPPQGGIIELEKRLSENWLARAVSQLMEQEVTVHLPRFKLRSMVDAGKALSDLGLANAFDKGLADFSGITRDLDGIFVSEVLQAALVETDEAGTEAAAATAVVTLSRSLRTHRVVRVNRPFLFLIRDDASGAPLFLGRVMDPR